jgi:uncharacterized protein with ParB-like and HNH nuclease domain
MSKKISGHEYALSKIFSSEFEFEIPSYQRPYAWEVENADELFNDLVTFFGNAKPEEGYFLGSVVLIKDEQKPHSEVIDGQQRLTTLTILLATMASMAFSGEENRLQRELNTYILEPGRITENIEAKPRLILRPRDQEFFHNYIQNLKIEAMIDLDPSQLDSEAKENIRENARYFSEILSKTFDTQDKLRDFTVFLMTRCYLVVVSTPNRDSAFRVFSVMDSRGLDLQPTDIIKAETIGKLNNESDEIKYNEKWEEMEVKLGAG